MGRAFFDGRGEWLAEVDWVDAGDLLSSGYLHAEPIEAGRFIHLRLPDLRVGLPTAEAEVEERAPEPVPADESTWVEIEVVDEEGRPCAGIVYEVKVPDGSKKTGRTDSSGFARINAPRKGRCELRLPELDADAWKLI